MPAKRQRPRRIDFAEQDRLAFNEQYAWGHTPRSRLSWLLDRVVYAQDLDQDNVRRARTSVLRTWMNAVGSGQPRWLLHEGARRDMLRAMDSARAFVAIVQRPLARAVADLATTIGRKEEFGFVFQYEFKGTVSLLGIAHDPGDGGWTFHRQIIGTSTEILLAAMYEAVSQVEPASLLRVCRFDGCERLFVGKKTQRTCAAHQVEARRQQYREAQAERRKRLKGDAEKAERARRGQRTNRRQGR